MTTYPRLLDLAGWALVVLAGFVALVAIIGIISILYSSSPSAIAKAEQRLHETYYVIQPSRTTVIPFTGCLLLACLVGYVGYSMTYQSVKRKISAIESDGPPNTSQPFR